MDEQRKATANAVIVAEGKSEKAIMAELAKISARVNELAATKSDEVVALRQQMQELQNRLAVLGVKENTWNCNADEWKPEWQDYGGQTSYDGAVFYDNSGFGQVYGSNDYQAGYSNIDNQGGGFGSSRGGFGVHRGGYARGSRGGFGASNRGGGYYNNNRGGGHFDS